MRHKFKVGLDNIAENLSQICELVEHLKFDNMKKQAVFNYISNPKKGRLRKGEVGDWRNYFDEKTDEKWDKWIQDNVEGTGLQFLSLIHI